VPFAAGKKHETGMGIHMCKFEVASAVNKKRDRIAVRLHAGAWPFGVVEVIVAVSRWWLLAKA
jgi:hypothetical protein